MVFVEKVVIKTVGRHALIHRVLAMIERLGSVLGGLRYIC